MISNTLPVLFNTHLHKRLGPGLLKEIKKTTKKDTDNVYLSSKSPAGELFNQLTQDPDIDFKRVLEESSQTNFADKPPLDASVEGVFSKMIYDYYRENTFDDGKDTYKKADVYLEQASDMIKKIQEDSFEKWIENFKNLIEGAEIDAKGSAVKIGKKDSKVVLKYGDTPISITGKFSEYFKNFMKSHFSFIPIDRKIKEMNKLYKQIKGIHTTKEIKKYMLVYFYDLVYAISITANFVSFEEAKKIISA